MKRLRLLVYVCLFLSAALLCASFAMNVLRADKTVPVISVPGEVMEISADEYNTETLLTGISARDGKDGDISDRIHVQSVLRQSENELLVNYAVCDKDNNVATASRVVRCNDITAPRFKLTAPLVYDIGGPVQVLDRLSATDSLEGDVTEKIRVIFNGISLNNEGNYPITFEVTNDFGDTSSISLDIRIKNENPDEPIIKLSDYIVYVQGSKNFEAKQYITEVIGGNKNDVTVKMPAGGLHEGINEVTFVCKGANGINGEALLYVIVE